MQNPKHRYSFSLLVTLLLYTSLVAAYIWWPSEFEVPKPNLSKEKAMVLSLATFAAKPSPHEAEAPVVKEVLSQEQENTPQPPKEEEVKEKEPQEEPLEEIQEPKEPEKREAPEEITPKPLPKEPEPKKQEEKPKPKPKPKVTKKVKKVKKKPHKPHKTKTKKKRKKGKHTQKRVVSGGGKLHYSAAARNRFLAQIRAKINRAKSYPKVAQRRGMQGVVKARFTILPNGHVSAITLQGSKVFYGSAKKAIRSAFPVNASKAPMKLPATITISLHYRLR